MIWIDIALGLVSAAALVEHCRARADYAIWPDYAGLAVMACVLLIPSYQRLTLERLRLLRRQAEDYAAGGRRIPWAAAVVLVALPLWLVYLANQTTLGATDTRPVIPTATSLLEQGDANLDEFFRPGAKLDLRDRDGRIRDCFRPANGGIYSSYPVGMVPFSLVTTGLCRWEGRDLHDLPVQRRLEKITAAGLAATIMGLFYLCALHLGTERTARLMAWVVGVGSGVFSTVAMALWQHGGILFWSTLILLIEFHDPRVRSPRLTLARGVCAGMLVTCRLTSISFLLPYGIWMAWRDPRRALVLVTVALLTFAPWSSFYQATYGTRFGPSTSFLAGRLWNFHSVDPILGVLVSPARGLLVYQPWIFAIPLAWLARRESGRMAETVPPRWQWFAWSAVLGHVILIAAWGCWWGGWCWGSRLLCDTLVLLGLLCVRPVERLMYRRRGAALVVGLAALAIGMQSLGVFWDTSYWNSHVALPDGLWSWTHAPFTEPLRAHR